MCCSLRSFPALLLPHQTCTVAALRVSSWHQKAGRQFISSGAWSPAMGQLLYPLRHCFGTSLFRNQAHIGPIVMGGSPHSISTGESQALKSPSSKQSPDGETDLPSYCIRVDQYSLFQSSFTHPVSCSLANPVRKAGQMELVPFHR